MRLESIAALLRVGAVSHDSLMHALGEAAPRAVNAVCAGHKPAGAGALARAVVPALPAALDIDVRECICHRWLPALRAEEPVPETVDWTLRPQLEWLIDGLPVALQLTVDVRLSQEAFSMDSRGSLIQLGTNGRAWRAWLRLAVADAVAGIAPVPFHECQAEVYLPAGPWPLARPAEPCRAISSSLTPRLQAPVFSSHLT